MATQHRCSGGRTARRGNPSPAHGSAVLSALSGSQREGPQPDACGRSWPRSRSPAVEGVLIEARPQRGDHNPRPASRAESSSRIN